MEHHFEVDHAMQYGIEEAIVIYNFKFWLIHNKANNKNKRKIEIDGKKVERFFTYNSAKSLAALFPYLNPKKIYRIMDSLEEQGVLIKANFNPNTYDRVNWYCFKDEESFLEGKSNSRNREKEIPKTEMEIPKSGNHDTDNKPDNKPDITITNLMINQQLKDFAQSNNLSYEINPDEDRKSQSKLVTQLSLTNEQVLKQVERLKPILADSKCDWWTKTNSFGFNFMLKNWGRIDSWHNAKIKKPIQVKQTIYSEKTTAPTLEQLERICNV